jgi:UDP-glucose 4-epimerase
MRILITGKNSFIGNSFFQWIKNHEPSFEVNKVSLKNTDLDKLSFKGYDVIFHVSGLAHNATKSQVVFEYYKINRDLAINVAKKAKNEGVKQFIFTSSIAIYGDDLPIGAVIPININEPKPNNAYGKSKLEADLAIQELDSEFFNTVILRIPMVYGLNSKGNFPKLFKFSSQFFIFPNISNHRSVLHINNLSYLVNDLIKNKSRGVYYPQDKKYLNTILFIKNIRKNKIIFTINFLNPLLKFLSRRLKVINKVFGNKFYPQDISSIGVSSYQVDNIYDFK